MKGLPERTTVDIQRRNSEEERFDEAVEGRKAVLGGRDLEKGSG